MRKEAEEAEDEDEDEDDDEEEDDADFDDDQDVEHDADEQYLAFLNGGAVEEVGASDIATIQAQISSGLFDMSAFDEDYDDDYSSAIDEVEQLIFCSEALQSSMQRFSGVYEPLVATAPGDLRGRCANLVQAAQVKAQQVAAERQQAQA
mmetsp:Transcript_1466/g.3903  ORF Transcript_1466/g.3903 Transcript_1466/m.3903 type:complete len:149 (-) Transcript_1466:257-703(-)